MRIYGIAYVNDLGQQCRKWTSSKAQASKERTELKGLNKAGEVQSVAEVIDEYDVQTTRKGLLEFLNRISN